MTPALAVFLKAPRLGTVKTRLAAEVGPRHALRLYRVMASRTLAMAREAGLDPTIWFTPADAGIEMRAWLGDEWDLRPQSSGISARGWRRPNVRSIGAAAGWPSAPTVHGWMLRCCAMPSPSSRETRSCWDRARTGATT